MDSRNWAWLSRSVSKSESTSGWAGTEKSMVKVLEGAVGVEGEVWGPSKTLEVVNVVILLEELVLTFLFSGDGSVDLFVRCTPALKQDIYPLLVSTAQLDQLDLGHLTCGKHLAAHSADT